MRTWFSVNLTLLGSMANLIVVQKARREATITFWDYLRVRAPIAVLSLAFGILWLR